MLAWDSLTMLRRLLCGSLLALALLSGAAARAQEPPPAPPALDAQFEPLRAAFNRDAETVRLLLLVDPT